MGGVGVVVRNHQQLRSALSALPPPAAIVVKGPVGEIISTGGVLVALDDGAVVERIGGDVEVSAICGNAVVDTIDDDVTVGTIHGRARIQHVCGHAHVHELHEMANIRYVGGDATITHMAGFAQIYHVRGRATVAKMTGNSVVKIAGENAKFGIVQDFANILRVCGNVKFGSEMTTPWEHA